MSYLHIQNLYKAQEIFLFKEAFAMEKIHGTSAHIGWNFENKKIHFFSGGEKHQNFVCLFNEDSLQKKFLELYPDSNATIFGEAYGGRQQGMADTYGKELKFIAFEVKIRDSWLSVPSAHNVCKKIGLDFVDYVKIPTTIEAMDAERDKDSVQAILNGCGKGKKREGVIIRPLIEVSLNNKERVIAKHKRDDFRETKTARPVTQEEMKILTDAIAIADEWVTEMRLTHVLDKLPQNLSIDDSRIVIDAMIEDVYREAKREIVESKIVAKEIGRKAVQLFKNKLSKKLVNN